MVASPGRIAVLGDIVFYVSEKYANAFDQLRREKNWKYAEHEIVKGKGRLQGLGRQLDQVTLGGQFFDKFCVPRDEMDRLTIEAEKGLTLPLVAGDEFFGEFVIERISETWKETDGNGHPRVIEFEVSLKEYN